MTATTTTTVPAPLGRTHPTRAEWTKIRTLRATWITIGVSLFTWVALAAVNAASKVAEWDQMSAAERSDFDATSTALVGVLFGTLVLGAIAVRSVTGEYSTGMVRVTFGAIPRRAEVLRAKATTVVTTIIVTSVAANLAAFLAAQQILRSKDLDVSLGDPGVARAIVFGAVGVGSFAVIALSLGVLLRRASPANILLSVIVIGGQILGAALPDRAHKYLPPAALQSIVSVERTPDVLDPKIALATLAAYASILYAVARATLGRRDA